MNDKFELGDNLICVKGCGNSLTEGENYIYVGVSKAACNTINVEKDGVILNGWLESRFKLAEPAFRHEYFSALNEEDTEKYVGKVMEFNDGRNIRQNNPWKKYKFKRPAFKDSAYSFESEEGYLWQHMRTCKEAFKKKKAKKIIERWANIYPDIMIDYYATKKAADVWASSSRIACVKLTGKYEVEE